MKRFALILILAAVPVLAQIPSGYVQTTATVSSLANGTYGASWTNLSSLPQLGLLGCVSTFQQTVNGRFDSNGHMSVLLADTAQICPTPSTWTFTLIFECVGSPTNGAFQVAVPVTGGGSTEDISSQITAALPSNPCGGGGGGGGGGIPASPAYAVQFADSAVTAFAADPNIKVNTVTHGLNVGGPIISDKLVLNSEQTTLTTPVIFDHFLYADGTVWSAQVAESGNSQWQTIGNSGPEVIDRHLTPTTPTTTPFYAALPNTSIIGGTPQLVTSIAGTFRLCPATVGVYDPTTIAPALIAAYDLTLAKIVHVNLSPSGWTLAYSLSGGGGLTKIASGQMNLAPDCKSEYRIQMNINTAAGTVQVFPPSGPPSAVITNSNITTIAPVYGIWESQIASTGAIAEWGSALLGGPPDADKMTALGGASPQTPVWALQGYEGTQQWVYPDNVGPVFTLHGAGWYKLASGAAISVSLIDEVLDATISDPAVTNEHFRVHAFAWSPTGELQLQQELFAGSSGLVDQVRISNDGAGNQELEMHLKTADAVTVAMRGTGIFTPATTFPGSSTALSSQKTLTFGGTPPETAFTSTLVGGVGWYTLATQQAGFSLATVLGQFWITADVSAVYTQNLSVYLIGFNGTCPVPQQIYNTSTTIISQVRCSSTNTGGQVQIDVYNNYAGTVNLTGNYAGAAVINTNPTVGAVPLTGTSNTLTLVNNDSVSLNNATIQAASLQVIPGRKGTFICTGGGTITITNANYIATSDVIITMNTAGGTITTPPAMKTVTPTTGFSVLCGASDTSTYNYSILN